jgi:hypothetical protein
MATTPKDKKPAHRRRRRKQNRPEKPARKLDQSAPFGRAEDGSPFAPYGLTASGKVRPRPMRGQVPDTRPEDLHAVQRLPEEAFGMAAIGCSDSEIAELYGIPYESWKGGLALHPDVVARLREARAKGTRSVTKALWNRATGQAFRDKAGNFLPPDIAAIKFWLCNRSREHWKSEAKLEVQHSGEIRDGRTGATALVEDLTDEQLVDYLAEIGVAVAKQRPEMEQAIKQAKKERAN